MNANRRDWRCKSCSRIHGDVAVVEKTELLVGDRDGKVHAAISIGAGYRRWMTAATQNASAIGVEAYRLFLSWYSARRWRYSFTTASPGQSEAEATRRLMTVSVAGKRHSRAQRPRRPCILIPAILIQIIVIPVIFIK
jgi:hypothetical protein